MAAENYCFEVDKIEQTKDLMEKFHEKGDYCTFITGAGDIEEAYKLAANGAKPHGTAPVAMLVTMTKPLSEQYYLGTRERLHRTTWKFLEESINNCFAMSSDCAGDTLRIRALFCPLFSDNKGKITVSTNKTFFDVQPVTKAFAFYLKTKFSEKFIYPARLENIETERNRFSIIENDLKSQIYLLRSQCRNLMDERDYLREEFQKFRRELEEWVWRQQNEARSRMQAA